MYRNLAPDGETRSHSRLARAWLESHCLALCGRLASMNRIGKLFSVDIPAAPVGILAFIGERHICCAANVNVKFKSEGDIGKLQDRRYRNVPPQD